MVSYKRFQYLTKDFRSGQGTRNRVDKEQEIVGRNSEWSGQEIVNGVGWSGMEWNGVEWSGQEFTWQRYERFTYPNHMRLIPNLFPFPSSFPTL